MINAQRIRSSVLLLICGLLFSQIALAFRSTHVESFTDPDYKDFHPKKVLVMVREATNESRVQIEQRLIDKLAEFGVVGVKERDLFPPTRDWTPEARREILTKYDIDSSLIVAVGTSSASIRKVGSQTFGSTTYSGNVNATSTRTGPNSVSTNGTVGGTANTNATSYDVFAANSKADFSAVLIDVTNGRTAWYADITTKAQGTLFVGEKGDAKGAVKGVIEGLLNERHLAK